jgi:hypothetical protein
LGCQHFLDKRHLLRDTPQIIDQQNTRMLRAIAKHQHADIVIFGDEDATLSKCFG